MKGYQMTADIALEFFQRCVAREAVTEKERLKILEEIVSEQKVIRLNDQDVQRVLKNKKVLRVRKENL